MDNIKRFLAYNGRVNIVCISTTNLVENAKKIHDLSPTATAALGRTLTMATIIASGLKGENDTVTLQIKGNGPIGNIVAVSDSRLRTRGYVSNPQVDVPLRKDGKINVGAAVGNEGFIYVIKDIGLKEPYVGMSKIVSGEIAEDFTNYFYISEQKNTAVALGVLVDKNGVRASGGYIITPMPDATEEDLFILENRIKEAKPISQMLDENMSLLEIAKDITGDEEIELVQEDDSLKYQCNCSKEKMSRALISIGKKELTNILEEDKKAETVCHFCNQKYEFTSDELQEMIDSL